MNGVRDNDRNLDRVARIGVNYLECGDRVTGFGVDIRNCRNGIACGGIDIVARIGVNIGGGVGIFTDRVSEGVCVLGVV